MAKKKVEIFQLQSCLDNYCDLMFESFSMLQQRGISVVAKNYKKVYCTERPEDYTLDSAYMEFNLDRPEDFNGHSLSVSDVVVIYSDGKKHCYYVDSVGFKELPDFDPLDAYIPTYEEGGQG